MKIVHPRLDLEAKLDMAKTFHVNKFHFVYTSFYRFLKLTNPKLCGPKGKQPAQFGTALGETDPPRVTSELCFYGENKLYGVPLSS